MDDAGPGLWALDETECRQRLGACGIGRVAVTIGALPAIFPVNYAMLDGDPVFLTGPGTKLDAATRGAVVAFEVDAADRISHAGWSVLVVGPAHRVTDPLELARIGRLPLAPWVPGHGMAVIRVESRLVSGRILGPVPPSGSHARMGV